MCSGHRAAELVSTQLEQLCEGFPWQPWAAYNIVSTHIVKFAAMRGAAASRRSSPGPRRRCVASSSGPARQRGSGSVCRELLEIQAGCCCIGHVCVVRLVLAYLSRLTRQYTTESCTARQEDSRRRAGW